MIRLATAVLLASLLAGTAMAQTTTGAAVSGAASTTGKAASGTAAKASKSAMKTGEYADEAAAKAKCAGDTVVWVNTSSKAIHMAGDKYYGKTKKGAYMCEKNAIAAGFHAPKAKSAKPAAKSN